MKFERRVTLICFDWLMFGPDGKFTPISLYWHQPPAIYFYFLPKPSDQPFNFITKYWSLSIEEKCIVLLLHQQYINETKWPNKLKICGMRQSIDLQDWALDKVGLWHQSRVCIFLCLTWQDYNLLHLVFHVILFDYFHNSSLPSLADAFYELCLSFLCSSKHADKQGQVQPLGVCVLHVALVL